MNKLHWIPKSVAAIVILAGTVISTTSVAASDEKGLIDPRNQAYEQHHPDQYQSWKETSESDHIEDALADDPNMVIMWAGYGLSLIHI